MLDSLCDDGLPVFFCQSNPATRTKRSLRSRLTQPCLPTIGPIGTVTLRQSIRTSPAPSFVHKLIAKKSRNTFLWTEQAKTAIEPLALRNPSLQALTFPGFCSHFVWRSRPIGMQTSKARGRREQKVSIRSKQWWDDSIKETMQTQNLLTRPSSSCIFAVLRRLGFVGPLHHTASSTEHSERSSAPTCPPLPARVFITVLLPSSIAPCSPRPEITGFDSHGSLAPFS